LFQKGKLLDVNAYDLAYHDIYRAHRKRKLRTAAVRLNRIARYLDNRRPKLLDVGCSLGATIEQAGRCGWDAHGVDISEDAVQYCRDRGLASTVTAGLALPFPDRTFDVLTAWHVIEHVPDVAVTLAEWRRVLKPGGLLVIETPDTSCVKVKWRGARYKNFWKAEHIYAFNRTNFEPFVRRAGLDILPYPWLGRLGDLSAPMAAYAVAYQLAKGAMRLAGLSKAFQVFCRRPPMTGHDRGRPLHARTPRSLTAPVRAKVRASGL
jgi:ubiquinone/menaquinone biosynthesis C-methylase UbiE